MISELPHVVLMEDHEKAERREKLRQLVQSLPDRQKEVIHLRFFMNLKNEEIAEVLNINYQSVSNLLVRALKKIKTLYTLPVTEKG